VLRLVERLLEFHARKEKKKHRCGMLIHQMRYVDYYFT